MRRTKSNRPEPLAKAFTKDNQIYFRLQTALMEDVSYNSVIGRNLVNFAFLDQDLLERCMLEFFAVYVQRRDRGVHPDSIEEELVERSRRLFVRNSYLSIYLLSGKDDPVTRFGKDAQKIYEDYRNRGIKDLTIKVYEKSRHALMKEENKIDVYNDIYHWLEERCFY